MLFEFCPTGQALEGGADTRKYCAPRRKIATRFRHDVFGSITVDPVFSINRIPCHPLDAPLYALLVGVI
jgi:hypothetical protein